MRCETAGHGASRLGRDAGASVGTADRRCTSVTNDRRRMSRAQPRSHTTRAGWASGQSSRPGRRGARLAGGRWEEDLRAGRCECGDVDVSHHRDQLLSVALRRVCTGRDISGSFTSDAREILRSVRDSVPALRCGSDRNCGVERIRRCSRERRMAPPGQAGPFGELLRQAAGEVEPTSGSSSATHSSSSARNVCQTA